ncbi:hypothetical protein [Flavobacterium pedocola]
MSAMNSSHFLMETLKITLPIIAILISIFSIYMGTKNNRRQIRIGKLEEISEGLLYISQHYMRLWMLLNDLKDINNKRKNNEETEDLEKRFEEDLEHLKKLINKDKIQQVGTRIEVLTNAYLPNGVLKNKILTFNHLMNILFSSVLSENYIYVVERDYPKGIPHPKKMVEFLMSVENEIIKEMNLGYSSLKYEDLKKYRLGDFIKDSGIEK